MMFNTASETHSSSAKKEWERQDADEAQPRKLGRTNWIVEQIVNGAGVDVHGLEETTRKVRRIDKTPEATSEVWIQLQLLTHTPKRSLVNSSQ
eukprot:SAG31_NODE_4326_length_3354_cov_11.627035_5_plen_93_part_00